jgi:hypothetical protein
VSGSCEHGKIPCIYSVSEQPLACQEGLGTGGGGGSSAG